MKRINLALNYIEKTTGNKNYSFDKLIKSKRMQIVNANLHGNDIAYFSVEDERLVILVSSKLSVAQKKFLAALSLVKLDILNQINKELVFSKDEITNNTLDSEACMAIVLLDPDLCQNTEKVNEFHKLLKSQFG
ncbi:hypothetical protein NI385_29950 (plasmid) [Vibrio parahaemolyticus]|uniref:Uncharacterized protein n=2 Tax=Vibrio TaxID=662 RepID=A0AAX0M7W5_VIBPH|nr:MULTISPECIES: hypothetical protein [Vibrio]EJG0765986.1 hypothetical protein [Vibrio parahaemolyticus O5:K30]MCA2471667.1 hypothetical protein [Vibrio alginolyticus]MCS0330327.1 hypothetical protein [Vibrio diabolicus]TVN06974.1 hypothetical protein FPV63_06725 [Vibrio cholerae]ARN69823.1 hypothetical protein FORC36_5306 [Vibrio vulnificus]